MYISMNFKIDKVNLSSREKIILRKFISIVERMPAPISGGNIINSIKIRVNGHSTCGNDLTFEYVEIGGVSVIQGYTSIPSFNNFNIGIRNFTGKKMDMDVIRALLELAHDLKNASFFNQIDSLGMSISH
jgi:hypothetical protein